MTDDAIPREIVESTYDELFAEAEKLFKDNPVCGSFEFGMCRRHINSVDNEALFKHEKLIESKPNESKLFGCCSFCGNNWSRNGCLTKNIFCKLYVCDWLRRDENKDLIDKLKIIKNKIYSLGFAEHYYISREAILGETIERLNNFKNYTGELYKNVIPNWKKIVEEKSK
jgi:hypothetical protein